MGEVDTGGSASGAIRRESGTAASLGAGDRLSLAATPTFAAMALLTAASGGSDMLCMAAQDTPPLSGMVSMYLLMSAFHSAPRSEEHTSELQSLMRIPYAVLCLQKQRTSMTNPIYHLLL